VNHRNGRERFNVISPDKQEIAEGAIHSLNEYAPARSFSAILHSMGTNVIEYLEDPLAHWGEISSIAREIGYATQDLPELIAQLRIALRVGQITWLLRASKAQEVSSVFSADTFQRECWALLRNLAANLGGYDSSNLYPKLEAALKSALSNQEFYGAHQVLYLSGVLGGKDAVHSLTQLVKNENSQENILLMSGTANALAMVGDSSSLKDFVKRLNSDVLLRLQEKQIMSRYYERVPANLRSPYLRTRILSYPYDQNPQVWGPFFSTIAGLLDDDNEGSFVGARPSRRLLMYLSASVRRDREYNLRIANQLRDNGNFEVAVPQEFTPDIPHERLDAHFVAMCDVAMDGCDAVLLLADVYGRDCATEVQRVHDRGKPVIAYLEKEGKDYVAEDWMAISRFTRVLTPSAKAFERLQATPILHGKVEFLEKSNSLPDVIMRILCN
jgi:hypothetical protein